MTQPQLEMLKNSAGKAVTIPCADGEILRGTIAYIDDEYRDVTFDLVSSNRPEKYKRGSCYEIKWDDIVDCRESPE
jgi:small nuclear ribonucleoprotein (snRNP)-like protein